MKISKFDKSHLWRLDNLLLILILFVASCLRFYRYSEIPFTYDEFSAWFRTQFDNFNDLIYYGVKTTDTHPAGVQVFEYYWIKFFGNSEVIVKLPFTIMGLLSIFFSYRISKKWFNSTVGLLVAALLASIQYMVMYSQIARPYISGLFLSLLMVWFWNKVIFESNKHHFRNLLGFTISAALCAYNHHFSLLFAALAGFTGLFYINRKYLVHYILSGIFIFVLYTPHLSIFFTQLNKGGVESWLGKPRPDFILQFLDYVLHFSMLMKGMIISIIALSFLLISKNLRQTNKYRIICLSWFIASYLIGYIYSVKVNALLQYSILIFVFPFVAIFAFSFFKEIKPLQKVILVIIILSMSIYTLIEKRGHYQYFYKSGYSETLLESVKVRKKLGQENVSTIVSTIPKIQDYYLNKYELNNEGFYYLDSTSNFIDFNKYISSLSTSYIAFGRADFSRPEYLQIIQGEFPYQLDKKIWFGSDFQVFSKSKSDSISQINSEEILFKISNGFEQTDNNWKGIQQSMIIDSIQKSGDHSLYIGTNTEYGPFFSIPLDSIIHNNNNVIQISVAAYFPVQLQNMLLISEIKAGDELIDWRGSQFSDFIYSANEWQMVYLSILLSDLVLNKKDLVLNVGIWNNNLQSCFVDNFEITTTRGNFLIYGLFEDFERDDLNRITDDR